MGEAMREKAMSMRDVQTLARDDRIGGTAAKFLPHGVKQISDDDDAKPEVGETVERGHPAPEALAGWLAA